MKKIILQIKNLFVASKNKTILSDINLTLRENEIHAILGPNGNGKTTLLQTIIGNPNFTIKSGIISYYGKKINNLAVDARAKQGIFISFQNPIEIPGVVNLDFLRVFLNNNADKKIELFELYYQINNASKNLKLPINYLERYLNENFSGGEKKQNELLHLKLRKPKLALIDEIDSGLDIDALKHVDKVINDLHKNDNLSAIIVSHYDKLYQNLNVTKFHVLINGKIYESGDKKLLNKIHKNGFDWCYEKYNLKKPEIESSILDLCAVPKSKMNKK